MEEAEFVEQVEEEESKEARNHNNNEIPNSLGLSLDKDNVNFSSLGETINNFEPVEFKGFQDIVNNNKPATFTRSENNLQISKLINSNNNLLNHQPSASYCSRPKDPEFEEYLRSDISQTKPKKK